MVSSPSLDETRDVEKLIPGSLSAIRSTALALADTASDFTAIAGMLNQVEVADWKGSAADEFRKKWHDLPDSWSAAARTYFNAHRALVEYQTAFDTARSAAEDAVTLYRRGQELTTHAVSGFHADQEAKAAEQAGKPHAPGPKSVALGQGFHDPGETFRREAQQDLDDARARLHRWALTASLTILDGVALAPKAPPTGWDQFWGGVNGVAEFPGNVVEGFLLAGWDTIASVWKTAPAKFILELVFSGPDITWKDLMTQDEATAASILAITKDPGGSLGRLLGEALDLKEWGTNPGHVIGNALFIVASFAAPGGEVAGVAGKAATVGGDGEKLLVDESKVAAEAAEAARRDPLTGNLADGSWAGEKLHLDAADNAVVQKYAADAAAAESRIRPGLQALVEGGSPDAHLVGLDDSVKFANSLKSKVATMMDATNISAAEAIGKIKDSVRYTEELPSASYTEVTTLTVDKMKSAGYELVGNRNTWTADGYSGFNTGWRDPSTGRTFELQFHTPESFDLKTVTHPIYEEIRNPSISPERRAELKAINDQLFAGLDVPPGAAGLKFPLGR